MAAKDEGSSEEFVEDDSAEEEESEASFDSEEDEVKTVCQKSFCGETIIARAVPASISYFAFGTKHFLVQGTCCLESAICPLVTNSSAFRTAILQ